MTELDIFFDSSTDVAMATELKYKNWCFSQANFILSHCHSKTDSNIAILILKD